MFHFWFQMNFQEWQLAGIQRLPLDKRMDCNSMTCPVCSMALPHAQGMHAEITVTLALNPWYLCVIRESCSYLHCLSRC